MIPPKECTDWHDLMKYLLQAGCSPTCEHNSGRTPLDLLTDKYRATRNVRGEQAVIEVGKDMLNAGGHVTSWAFPLTCSRYSSLSFESSMVSLDHTMHMLSSLNKQPVVQVSNHQELLLPPRLVSVDDSI